MKLQDFVVPEAIIASLQGTERDVVIAELIDALVAANAVPAELRDELLGQIIAREQTGSTGFGKGVAVPHVKHAKITRMVAGLGISAAGVEFNALDKAPVYGIFLLLSPKDQPDEHLHAMENIFGHLQQDTFRRFLRQASTSEEVLELLDDADAHRL